MLLATAQDAASPFTWGGEARTRFESFSRRGFGLAGTERDDYVLQRVFLHGDVHVEDFRAHAELVSASAFGEDVEKPPTQAGETDVHQAFVEPRFGDFTLRAGRTQLALGSSRLVGLRDGTNVRLAFDGVRATWRSGGAQLDALALRPVIQGDDAFDDASSASEALWGLYGTWTLARGDESALARDAALTFDAYWLVREREDARFESGAGRELRHTFGVRVAGVHAGWDHDTEAVFQLGTFAAPARDEDIAAWTLATHTGYTFVRAPWSPRVGLKLDYASGDRDADDAELGTFDPLYPRNPYFSEAGLFAPYNFFDVHPSLTLTPRAGVEIAFAYDAFFRADTHDAVFSGSRIAIPGDVSTRHHVGDTLELRASWRATHTVSFELAWVHLFAGDVVRDAGGRDTDFAALWAVWSF